MWVTCSFTPHHVCASNMLHGNAVSPGSCRLACDLGPGVRAAFLSGHLAWAHPSDLALSWVSKAEAPSPNNAAAVPGQALTDWGRQAQGEQAWWHSPGLASPPRPRCRGEAEGPTGLGGWLGLPRVLADD